MRLQKLKSAQLMELYAKLLREGRKVTKSRTENGLSPASVRYVHRVVHRALGRAVIWELIATNPRASGEAPKAAATEIEMLSEPQVKEVLTKLRGRPMWLMTTVGLARLGCGPNSVSPMGLGKEADDALVFPHPDGTCMIPNSVSTEWRRLVRTLGLPKVSLHSWRHTHAIQLIASGMDVLTISRRLGRGSPSITLDVYGHLFHKADDRAATILERDFGATIATGRERNGSTPVPIGCQFTFACASSAP